jgi:hypothetical protein
MNSRIQRWALALILGLGFSLAQQWAGATLTLPGTASATLCTW